MRRVREDRGIVGVNTSVNSFLLRLKLRPLACVVLAHSCRGTEADHEARNDNAVGRAQVPPRALSRWVMRGALNVYLCKRLRGTAVRPCAQRKTGLLARAV